MFRAKKIFAVWDFAIAAENALGLESGDFWRAYNISRETARSVVLESSPLAEAIRNLVSREASWQGTAQQLLKTLESHTEEATLRSKFWPKSSTSLSRQLNRLTPDLEAIGIQVTIRKSNGIKFIFFSTTPTGRMNCDPSDPDQLDYSHSKGLDRVGTGSQLKNRVAIGSQ